MIVAAEQKSSSHSVTFSSSKLHLGMQSAAFLLSCSWFGSILGGSCQRNRQTQRACKCICIFVQLGESYTSDEGEGQAAEFALLLVFAVPPSGFPVQQGTVHLPVWLQGGSVDISWPYTVGKAALPPQAHKASVHRELLLSVQHLTLSMTVKVSLCLCQKMALK